MKNVTLNLSDTVAHLFNCMVVTKNALSNIETKIKNMDEKAEDVRLVRDIITKYEAMSMEVSKLLARDMLRNSGNLR